MQNTLHQYFKLLSAWNKHINLTSIESEEDFLVQHAQDSLSILPFLDDAKSILDLGTGAGIPGIIVKIRKPDIKVTLIDSTRKKISFCDEVIRKLELKNINAIWGRAEDEKIIKQAGKFDCVVSRATWKLGEFLTLAVPYLAPNGKCIAMKGPKWEEEFNAFSASKNTHHLKLTKTHKYTLKTGYERILLVFSPLAL